MVSEVVDLLGQPALCGGLLVVDQTGIGRPVVDMLTDAMQTYGVDCRLCPLTITGGLMAGLGQGGAVHVPKRELVGTMQVLLQSRRLQIAAQLPEAAALVRELSHFGVGSLRRGTRSFKPAPASTTTC